MTTINPNTQLSEHFKLGEFTKSNHPEVYNIPSHVAIENMKRILLLLTPAIVAPN